MVITRFGSRPVTDQWADLLPADLAESGASGLRWLRARVQGDHFKVDRVSRITANATVQPGPTSLVPRRSGATGERQALVTGAASGIGAAISSALQAEGVRVVGFDLVEANACDAFVVGDVGDAQAIRSVVDRYGHCDFAVTAAGYYETLDLTKPDPFRWREMVRVHVSGTLNVIDAVLPGMYSRRTGSICTVSSELALIGDPQAPHYAAVKGTVAALTKSVAVEAAPYGVRLNCLAPGPCDTPLLPAEHRASAAVDALPLKRLLRPAEVAACAVWLLLEETNVVGQVVSPNAGSVL